MKTGTSFNFQCVELIVAFDNYFPLDAIFSPLLDWLDKRSESHV